MIRRSVKKSFHTVWWRPPPAPLPRPCILIANHHGWHDGYLAYLATCQLEMPSVMWVQELGAFPLFGKLGALPFPAANQAVRTKTILRTIRLLRTGQKSLILFPEGVLHPPPDLRPFGASLEFLRRHLPNVPVVPMAILYEQSMHERPVAHLLFGEPISQTVDPGEALNGLLVTLREQVDNKEFAVLAAGTPDVNERWDLRRRRPR